MEFLPAVAMLALIAKIVDALKFVQVRDWKSLTTQCISWVAGVLVFALVAQTEWADGIEVGDRPLSQLGFWSLVFAGMTIASGASMTKDALKIANGNIHGVWEDTEDDE